MHAYATHVFKLIFTLSMADPPGGGSSPRDGDNETPKTGEFWVSWGGIQVVKTGSTL